MNYLLLADFITSKNSTYYNEKKKKNGEKISHNFQREGKMLKFCMCLTVRVCITIYAVPTEFPISVNCKNKVNYGGRRFYTLLDPTIVRRQL